MSLKQELWDELQKKNTTEMEILLKRIKSINFYSPVGCDGKIQEYFSERQFNQHSMFNDFRKEFAVCYNTFYTINIIKNNKNF